MCDFDNKDLCSWSNSQNNNFDWTLKSGSTPTPLTGNSKKKIQLIILIVRSPFAVLLLYFLYHISCHLKGPQYDHTQNNLFGYYAFIETTNVEENAKASLVSEPLDNKEPGCLQFWYHMYGDVS